ncbi:PREDICTED: uncharacterized protein LOC109584509 [Amphimedon queenslandica]|uniref:Uncharacterized protein n=1 Tax=Amphimedon queenslandica TaxID=400682 RepID=A0AAN0JFL5_AMPQE|nr:PREDICTED: uncharacterized protein LOC109584509 [Amphimedon queenslandica]|eukprot:XP_019855830.1 PREDICTED: uncharacterized protein LOC109584509 [Amphimedon queenslandica]
MPDDHDDEGETVHPKRGRAWTTDGHGRDEAQALTEVDKFQTLMGALNHKLRKEMADFSNTNISSHITVNNETPHPMMYHQCFLVRGRISGYHGLNENIPSKSKKCFSFEKYSSLSLDGCAAMIFLSASTCESTPCYFVIAFRNYVKFKNLTRNKAAILILNDAKSMNKISNSQSFGKIMRNKKENPHKDIDGCYEGDIYNPPFMAASLDESGSHDFQNMCFRIGMIDNPSRSQVNVTVEHPNQLG